ncbi:MAG: PspA/IM30 family protein, partial [Leptolyngbyaceae cyanobacterium SU_3_3]|nr:PspA/IM30 family protein [Leptolyngbyaceae cyanobacterium SU_3_3]
LESKISEAKTKKDLYIARARSAKASQQLNEMLGGVGAGSAMNAFERMEEKVMQLEAQSEAIAELGTDQLEKRFEALGESDEIDDELALMKNQLAGGNSAPLPPGAATPEIDPELEKLRSQIRGS